MEIFTCNVMILTQLFGMLTSLSIASFLFMFHPEAAQALIGVALICASGAVFAFVARRDLVRSEAKKD